MLKPMNAPKDIAEYLEISEANLARMRFEGRGPKFIKLGSGRQGKIRYRKEAVEEWLAAREFSSTAEESAA